MLDKGKAPAKAATLAGAQAEANRAGVNFCCDFTTPANKGQFKIAPLLGHGEEAALTTADLLKLTGFRTARELQTQIAKERRSGATIFSTCRNGGGYYLPGPQGEMEAQQFIRTLESRARGTFVALQCARRYLGEVTGQTSLLSGGGEGNAEEKVYPGT